MRPLKCLEEGTASYLWPNLLQRAEGSDVRVRHCPRDRNPEQEASLNVTGEIKPWKVDCWVSLRRCWIWKDQKADQDVHSPPMCVYREAVSPPSGP